MKVSQSEPRKRKTGDELLYFWKPPGWTAKCCLMYVTLSPFVRKICHKKDAMGSDGTEDERGQ